MIQIASPQILSLGYAILSCLIAQIAGHFLIKQEVPNYSLLHKTSLLLSLLLISLLNLFFQTTDALNYNWHPLIPLLFGVLTAAFTDVQTLLISRWSSLFLAPVGLLFSNLGLIPINPLESILGALTGLITLGLTARVAKRWTGQESIGQGDVDLLILIGTFLGPISCFKTLLFGSILGSLFGIGCFLFHGYSARKMHLPLGTFLALGTLIELLTQLDNSLFPAFL